jgi:tape measure domain-containing protein
MSDLGDLIVTYTADVSGLQSGADQAKSSIEEVGDTAEESSGGFASAFSNMGGNLMDFAQSAASTLFSVQMLGQTALSLGEDLLSPAEKAETMQTAFTTLMGSTKAANAELEKLDAFAAKTPFQTMDIDQAASQLIGFGVSASDTIPDLTAIGDALSAVGKGSTANLDGIVDIFGKIQTSGGLTVGTMQELSRDGINAWSIMEQQTGKTKDELTKMIQAGLIPAKDAMHDLTTGIEKSPLYSGGMAKQSNTMAGLISTLKSNWDQILVSFGSPILKDLEPTFAALATDLSSPAFKTFAGDVGKGIVTVIGTLATDIGTVVSDGQGLVSFFQSASPQAQLLADGLTAVGIAIAAIKIGQFVASIPALVSGFVAWAAAEIPVMIETLATAAPFLLIGLIVAAVVFGIILAIQHWGAISAWLSSAWKAMTDAVGAGFSALGTFLHGIVDNVTGFFKKWGIDILEIMMGPVGLIIHFWNPITGFFRGIISDIGNAFSGLGTFVSGVWNGLGDDVKTAINGIIFLIDDFIGGVDSIGIHVGPVNIQPDIPQIPYLASGTQSFAGGWAVVGEKGPELVNLPGGSSVIPNGGSYPIKPSATAVASASGSSTGSASAGSGSTTVVVELDGVQLAKVVAKHTDALVRLKLGPKGRAA